MDTVEAIKIFFNPVNLATGIVVVFITYRVIKKIFVRKNE